MKRMQSDVRGSRAAIASWALGLVSIYSLTVASNHPLWLRFSVLAAIVVIVAGAFATSASLSRRRVRSRHVSLREPGFHPPAVWEEERQVVREGLTQFWWPEVSADDPQWQGQYFVFWMNRLSGIDPTRLTLQQLGPPLGTHDFRGDAWRQATVDLSGTMGAAVTRAPQRQLGAQVIGHRPAHHAT
jgi:hypothetical protein